MKVGFIGLGTMGAAMAQNILTAGHTITVHNRNRDRELLLTGMGANRAPTPQECAASADVVVVSVSDTPDVEMVLLGDYGVIKGAKPGTIVIDTSTISPDATRKMAVKLAEKGIKLLDAPVSGGSEGAQKATLSIMIGGDARDVEKAMPVLKAMGSRITHVGPIGAGQTTKIINQVIAGSMYYCLAEGITLGLKAGLDMDKVLEAVSAGVARSWVLENRSENMIKNDYPLGFRVKLHQKDLGIALDAAKQLGVALPLVSFLHQLETSLIARGHGDEDLSSVARIVRELAGI